jgi:hypothetical protein
MPEMVGKSIKEKREARGRILYSPMEEACPF